MISLRARLLVVIVALIATYMAMAVLIVSNQRSLLTEQIDARLHELRVDTLVGLAPQPGRPAPGGENTSVPLTGEDDTQNPFSAFFIGQVDADGTITPLVVGATVGTLPDLEAAVRETRGESGIVTITTANGAQHDRARVVAMDDGTWIVVSQSMAEIDSAIGRLVRTLWVAGAIIASVLGFAVFWVQRLGLRPIAHVTAAAEAITAGHHSYRIDVGDTRTEAGKLGTAFNTMLDERDLSEQRSRQFVADASHELRTPLTSMRGYLELYRQGDFRDWDQLDDVMRRLAAETSRMHGLVQDLFSLASLDERRPLQHDRVDLGQLLRDAAQDARAIQPRRDIHVLAPTTGPTIEGDLSLLIQGIGVLVSNALSYTPESAALTLIASWEGTRAIVQVNDTGPGLPPALASKVFDRFWRDEASRTRTRNRGGAGLGLSIARSIVLAHGGTISLETSEGNGCHFTIMLPPRPLHEAASTETAPSPPPSHASSSP